MTYGMLHYTFAEIVKFVGQKNVTILKHTHRNKESELFNLFSIADIITHNTSMGTSVHYC